MTPSMVVFTAVIGRHTDTLRPLALKNPALSYRCVTDDPSLNVDGWEMVRVDPTDDPVRQARRLKILAHETVPDDVDVTLWIDAAFDLRFDPVQIVWHWLWKADMLALRHPDRQSIAQEADELSRLGMVPMGLLQPQLDHYRQAGFDPTALRGITSSGFCVRRHAPRVARFNRLWWDAFVAAGHTRDQMSIDYTIWRSGLDVAYLTGHYRSNPYAKWSPRPRSR